MFQQREGHPYSCRYPCIDGTLIRGRYLCSRRGVRTRWPAARGRAGGGLAEPQSGRVRMTLQSYKPEINLTALETASKQKRFLGVLLALVVLGAFVLVLMYYRWFGNILTGSSNEASVSTSDTTAEKSGHVSPNPSRRTSSKHRADAVVPPASGAQLTFAPGISESAIRSPLAVE